MKVKDLLKKHIVDAESFKVIEDQHNGLSKVVMEKKNIAEVLEIQELLEKEVAEVLTTNTGEIEVWVDAGDSFYDKTTISILKKRDKIKNAVIDISLILAALVLLYCKTTLIPGAEKNTLTVNITEYDVLSLLMVIGLVDRKLIRTSLTCILTILLVLINGFITPQLGSYVDIPMVKTIFGCGIAGIYVVIMGYITYMKEIADKKGEK